MLGILHVLRGTCFLVGMGFDNDVDDSPTAQDIFNDTSSTSAGIELTTSKRLQDNDNRESDMLQAKVTYSTLISFIFTFSDDVCRGVRFDTTSEEEKATIALHGLTEYFELKYLIIKDKNIIAQLKHFIKRRESLIRLNKQQINPQAFYATRTFRASTPVFESFSRQELAFRHYDNTLLHQDPGSNPLKLFTFESLMTGKRQFLVADMDSFMRRYLSLEGPKRHVYEIIRDNFPCRLYFDLEYSILTNPDVNGEQHAWHVVCCF
jgi:hypothetical protein